MQLSVLEFSYRSSKLPVSTNPEYYKHGYVLNAESYTENPLRVVFLRSKKAVYS
jgi:hypothetical protein